MAKGKGAEPIAVPAEPMGQSFGTMLGGKPLGEVIVVVFKVTRHYLSDLMPCFAKDDDDDDFTA